MAGPAIPIIMILSTILKLGVKEATKKYGIKEVNQVKKLYNKYEKTLDTDESSSDYSTPQAKSKATRAANSLSKSIKESLGPDAGVNDNISIRTLLQNLKKDSFNKGGLIDYRKTGMFKK